MRALMILMAAAVFAHSAQACSCLPVSRDDIIAKSDIALKGRVLRVKKGQESGRTFVAARLRILEAYKGVRAARNIWVRTPENSAMCGWEFKVGEIVSLAANNDGSGWYGTGLCSIVPMQQN